MLYPKDTVQHELTVIQQVLSIYITYKEHDLRKTYLRHYYLNKEFVCGLEMVRWLYSIHKLSAVWPSI